MRLTKAIRVFVAVICFAVVLELCTRVDDYFTWGAPLLSVYNNESIYMHTAAGKVGKPYGHYRKWRLNALGLRGPDLVEGRFNIVIFGASETFGLYEAPGKEYPRELERVLNERAGGPVFQVVNAAYPGQTLLTAIDRVPEIATTVRPHIALVYPVPALYIWLPYLKPRSNSPPPAPPREKVFELRVQEKLRTLLKTLLPDAVQTRIRQYEIQKSAARFPVMDRLPEENVLKYRADILAMLNELRRHGIQPVLLTHLNVFGPKAQGGVMTARQKDLLTTWRKFYPMLGEGGFVDMEDRFNNALRAVAAEENIPLIDLARTVPAEARNFADFAHFTDEGAALIAGRVADQLRPLLEPAGAHQTAAAR